MSVCVCMYACPCCISSTARLCTNSRPEQKDKSEYKHMHNECMCVCVYACPCCIASKALFCTYSRPKQTHRFEYGHMHYERVCVCECVCVCMYLLHSLNGLLPHRCQSKSTSLNMDTCTMNVCVCVCVCIYMYLLHSLNGLLPHRCRRITEWTSKLHNRPFI
jgi:hypothetical protein